jgi:hypothetical protein
VERSHGEHKLHDIVTHASLHIRRSYGFYQGPKTGFLKKKTADRPLTGHSRRGQALIRSRIFKIG